MRCRKTLHNFGTAESGTEYHEAPMSPQTHYQVVHDWLDPYLGAR